MGKQWKQCQTLFCTYIRGLLVTNLSQACPEKSGDAPKVGDTVCLEVCSLYLSDSVLELEFMCLDGYSPWLLRLS